MFDWKNKDLVEYAEKMKALGHPLRLCMALGLVECEGCNVKKIQKCTEVPQSTISQHLDKLKNAGIIAGERKGNEIVYRVIDPGIKKLLECIFSCKEFGV